jgi:universal stress protein A
MIKTELTYNKILVPIDFSDTSRKAFYIALTYAKLFEAETTVLHIDDVGHTIDDMERTADDLARFEEGVKRRLNELWGMGGIELVDRRRVHLEIRGGKPWSEVVRFAGENEVDLIVMGTHGRSGIKSLFIGSQCERVVRHAPCDVVVVKADNWEPTLDAPPEKFKV